MALKLDNLWKHGGRRKKIMAIPKVYNVGEYYMNKDIIHAKNERLYATTNWLFLVISSYLPHAIIGYYIISYY